MPTHNRRAFIPKALEYFLRQDYERKELLVLDDGEDKVEDLIPPDPRIRYLRLDKHLSLGAKRNRACELAKGDLIAHWDDDDWHARERLSCQVETLLQEDADVCGMRQLLFVELETKEVWLYSYPSTQRSWVAGGSMVYKRSFWQRNPFPEIQVGEDTRFLWNQKARVAIIPRLDLYVASIHDKNTSRRNCRGAFWSRWHGNLAGLTRGEFQPNHLFAPADTKVTVSAATPKVRAMTKSGEKTPRVTVTLPYYQCKPFIRRAVESILHQSYSNLQLVVVNDGDADAPWSILADIDDPRLIRFDLQANRGRYFADNVVLSATRDPYFMIQDADDWSERNRLELSLKELRARHADVVVAATLTHQQDSNRAPRKNLYQPPVTLTKDFAHRLDHYALFRSQALRNIGGYYAGFRIGYDTLLMNLLLMTTHVASLDTPLYNRFLRAGSLVHSEATGYRSPTRQRTAVQLSEMYQTARGWYEAYLAGSLEAKTLARQIQSLCLARLSTEEKQATEEESTRLKTVLANHARQQTRSKQMVKPLGNPKGAVTAPTVATILNHPALRWNGWAIEKTLASKLIERLSDLRPSGVLETGSGNSTVVLAACAKEFGFQFVSLEHDRAYHQRTKELLKATHLASHVDLRLAPLKTLQHPNGSYVWYDTTLTGKYPFVFVDGPPMKFGRQGALFALAPHLPKNWELWLHDGLRSHEKMCVEQWSKHFQFNAEICQIEDKGMVVLQARNAPEVSSDDLAEKLCIGILTGGRLDLLQRTLECFEGHSSTILSTAFVFVLVNGPDDKTASYVKRLPFVNEVLYYNQTRLAVGQAASLLTKKLTELSSAPYLLYLEDDWSSSAKDSAWLHTAYQLLETHPEIGQVRLRQVSERVLPYHMVTGQPIIWEQRHGFSYARAAHFTFNPSLVRTRDVPRIFPCKDELEAQRKYLATHLAVAQLLPGVFFHSGTGRSLRTGHPSSDLRGMTTKAAPR